MGLRTPYGNNPSSLPNPAQANLTLAGLQQLQSMNQVQKIPGMEITSDKASATQPSPDSNQGGDQSQGRQPSSDTGILTPEEMKLVSQMTPSEQKAILSAYQPPKLPAKADQDEESAQSNRIPVPGGSAEAVSPKNASALQEVGRALGKVQSELDPSRGLDFENAGAILGGAVGELIPGVGTPAGIVLSGAGADAGKAIQNFLDGKPLPSGSDTWNTFVDNATFAGVAHSLAAATRAIGTGIESSGMKAAVKQVQDAFDQRISALASSAKSYLGSFEGNLPAGEWLKAGIARQSAVFDAAEQRVADLLKDKRLDVTNLYTAIGSAIRGSGLLDATGKVDASLLTEEQKPLFQIWNLMNDKERFAPMSSYANPDQFDAMHAAMQKGQLPPDGAMIKDAPGTSGTGIYTDWPSARRVIQNIQAAATSAIDRGAPSASMWGNLSSFATASKNNLLIKYLEPLDPEAAAQFRAVSEQFHNEGQIIKSLQKTVEQNPSSAARVLIDNNNPRNTEIAFHYLTPTQQRMIRSQKLLDAYQASVGQNGVASAKDILKNFQDMGEENLKTVLGPTKDDDLRTLRILSQIQSVKNPSSQVQAGMIRALRVALGKSALMANALGLLPNLVPKASPYREIFNSPDFRGAVANMGLLNGVVARVGGQAVKLARIPVAATVQNYTTQGRRAVEEHVPATPLTTPSYTNAPEDTGRSE